MKQTIKYFIYAYSFMVSIGCLLLAADNELDLYALVNWGVFMLIAYYIARIKDEA